jgi:hypothetical protein
VFPLSRPTARGVSAPPARRAAARWGAILAFASLVLLMLVDLHLAVLPGFTLEWSDAGWTVESLEADGPADRGGLAVGDTVRSVAGIQLEKGDLNQGFDYAGSAAALKRWFQRNAERYRRCRADAPIQLDVVGPTGDERQVQLAIPSRPWLTVLARLLPWYVIASAFFATALVVWRRAPPTRPRDAFVWANLLVSASVLTSPGAHFGHAIAFAPGLFSFVPYANQFTGSAGIAAAAVFFLQFPGRLLPAPLHDGIGRHVLPASLGMGALCTVLAAIQVVPPGAVISAMMLVILGAIPAQVVVARKRGNPTLLGQVRWIGIGVFLPTIAWIALIEVPHVLEISELVSLDVASLAFAVIPIATGFAITRHRLLEVDLVVRRILLISLIFVLIVATYMLALRFWPSPSLRPVHQDVVFLLAVGLALLPMVVRLETLFERFFPSRSVLQRQALIELPDRLARARSLDGLAEQLLDIVDEVAAPEHAVVYAFHERQGVFFPVAVRDYAMPPPDVDAEAPWITELEEESVQWRLPRLEAGQATAQLAVAPPAGLGAALLLMLRSPVGLGGFLVAGPRRSGQQYDAPVLRVLTAVTTQAATYMANLRLVDEVSDLRRLEREFAQRQQRTRCHQRPGHRGHATLRPGLSHLLGGGCPQTKGGHRSRSSQADHALGASAER